MKRVMLAFVVGLLCVGGATAADPQAKTAGTTASSAPPARLPPPSKEARAAAEKIVLDLFKTEFEQAGRGGADAKAALAKKLLEQAGELNDDPAARYVLLVRSQEIATAAGDITGLVDAINTLSGQYVVDGPSEKFTALTIAVKNLRNAEANAGVLDAAEAAIVEAIHDDNLEVATKLVRFAAGLAAKTHNGQVAATLKSQGLEIDLLKKEWIRIADARKKLLTMPDDADANLAIGFYEAAMKDDFPVGLPKLAKGADKALREAAALELAMPTSASDQARLADSWWSEADKHKEPVRSRLRGHAVHWYTQCEPHLTGLAKAQAAARIKQYDTDRPNSPAAAQAAITKALTTGNWHIVWYASKTERSGPIASEYPKFRFKSDGTFANISGASESPGKWQFLDNNSLIIEATYDDTKVCRFRFELKDDSLNCENYNPPTALMNIGLGHRNPSP